MPKAVQCAAFFVVASGALSAHAAPVTFQNRLSACVTVEPGAMRTEANLVLAETTIRLHKPIGECGCFSALASYAASVDRGGVRQTLQEGLVSLKDSGPKTLVLATEPALAANIAITIRLGCASPL